jgi:hypothetical protein
MSFSVRLIGSRDTATLIADNETMQMTSVKNNRSSGKKNSQHVMYEVYGINRLFAVLIVIFNGQNHNELIEDVF